MRETLEHSQLEEGGERVLHALAREEIEVPRRPPELVVAMMHVPLERLEGRMDRERHVQILRGGEDGVVRRRPVRDARNRERAHKGAAAAVADGTHELSRRFRRVTEREVRDGNEPAAR